MALCPNCASQVTIDAASCPACGADFEGVDAWKPQPRTDEERRVLAATQEALAVRKRAFEATQPDPNLVDLAEPEPAPPPPAEAPSLPRDQGAAADSPPPMPKAERVVRLIFAAPFALVGALALFFAVTMARHGLGEIAPFVFIPAFVLLASAYSIATTRSGGVLATAIVVGGLMLLLAWGAVHLLGALTFSR